jgi:hypothetical protein
MKKQCSGANLRSWRHSRSQLQRVTIEDTGHDRRITCDYAQLYAEGRVGWPHTRDRRHRWADRSGRKDPWDRCAYNSRSDCKNRRPPKALAAYLPTSIVYNARIFCALRSRQE